MTEASRDPIEAMISMAVEHWADELTVELSPLAANALKFSLLTLFVAELDQVRQQLAEANTILRDPLKWQAWCDNRMLERAEAAEAKIDALLTASAGSEGKQP